MKVLVATASTQGARPNDYCWTVEGELVRVDEVCRTDLEDPDGGCGCGRGFAGLASHHATTTARVAEVDLGVEEYAEAIRSSLEAQGYEPDGALVREEAEVLRTIAAALVVGTVLERRLWNLHVRSLRLDGAV